MILERSGINSGLTTLIINNVKTGRFLTEEG